LIQRATQLIAEVFYPDNFGLLLLDESRQSLRAHPSYRAKQSLGQQVFQIGRGVVGRVALEGKPQRIEDVTQEADYVQIDPLTHSELCVPVKIGDQVIGVINAESTRPAAFNENDERLLATFAGQLAIAFQKVRLFEAERRRAAELEALRQAGLRLTSNLDLQTLLEIILDRAIQLVTADTAHLFLYDGQELVFGAAFWASGHPKSCTIYRARAACPTTSRAVGSASSSMMYATIRCLPIRPGMAPWSACRCGAATRCWA
jgi:GAF domain-containing protein